MHNTARRPSLKTVAEDVGVSAMTVSNAFNRPDRVAPVLREQVLDAARRLGYPGPDPLARGLRRGRVGALGLVHDTRLSYAVRDPALLAFLAGLGDELDQARVGLLLVSGAAFGERDATAISDALVDGLVVYSVADGDPLVAAALERRIPIAIVDQPHVPDVAFVGIDNRAAARVAASHLVKLGHRRTAVISLPLLPDGRPGPAETRRQQQTRYLVHRHRLSGYRDAIAGAGLDWSQTPVYECAENTIDSGRQAAAVLLDDCDPRPSALLAMSDQLALGAATLARERQLEIPRELSIVGFDDIPAAATHTPPLTTVRQPHHRKGQLAAQLLLASLRGNPLPDPEPLHHQLIDRDTTAPPPT